MARSSKPNRRLLLYRLLTRIRPAYVASHLKRALGVERWVAEAGNGRFFVDPASQLGLAILQHGAYEPEMIQTLEKLLKPANIFLDIGANEGYFAVLGSRLVGEPGRVVAVEPQERLSSIITKNLELNGVSNTVVDHRAVSDQHGRGNLFISPDMNTGSTGFVRPTKYSLPTQSVNTITLSELFDCHGIERADVMKLDIESFEYEAILGSTELFKEQRVGAVALELHPEMLRKRGRRMADITDFLESCGYRSDKELPTLVYRADMP